MTHSTARIETTTRTIHTLTIVLPDDALADLAFGDDVDVTFQGRAGQVTKRLTYGDINRLTRERGM